MGQDVVLTDGGLVSFYLLRLACVWNPDFIGLLSFCFPLVGIQRAHGLLVGGQLSDVCERRGLQRIRPVWFGTIRDMTVDVTLAIHMPAHSSLHAMFFSALPPFLSLEFMFSILILFSAFPLFNSRCSNFSSSSPLRTFF